MASPEEIVQAASEAFPAEVPAMTLRQGDAVDSYRAANETLPGAGDSPTDSYLESYHWGIAHLDAHSWKCYLPCLIRYAVRHCHDGSSLVIDAFLQSLRPPDREPPRLASLDKKQATVIVAALDFLAFNKESAHQDFALQVLEEYWIPNSLYPI